jgi:tRNA-2-methylthio-N6-dimethylallyladenosine synthase
VAEKRYADDIADAVKRRRNAELLAAQKQAGLAHHAAFVGREMEVLVEGPSPRERKGKLETSADGQIELTGRTRGDHIVIFTGPAELADSYATVAITRADSLALFGELRERA